MSTYYERRPPSSPLAACVALLTLLCLLVFGGGLVWWFWPWGRTGLDPNAQPRPVAARGDLAPLEQANIEIYEQASPAVVHVTNAKDTDQETLIKYMTGYVDRTNAA